jgi:hypothetical protein
MVETLFFEEELAKRKYTFATKYSPQGNKVIIVVPKEHYSSILNLKNPLTVSVEGIIKRNSHKKRRMSTDKNKTKLGPS